MPHDYVTLMGADDVQRAGSRISEAAQRIESAASSICEAAQRIAFALQDHSRRAGPVRGRDGARGAVGRRQPKGVWVMPGSPSRAQQKEARFYAVVRWLADRNPAQTDLDAIAESEGVQVASVFFGRDARVIAESVRTLRLFATPSKSKSEPPAPF